MAQAKTNDDIKIMETELRRISLQAQLLDARIQLLEKTRQFARLREEVRAEKNKDAE